ncbi:unnamed protein product [Linum trigynum]
MPAPTRANHVSPTHVFNASQAQPTAATTVAKTSGKPEMAEVPSDGLVDVQVTHATSLEVLMDISRTPLGQPFNMEPKPLQNQPVATGDLPLTDSLNMGDTRQPP